MNQNDREGQGVGRTTGESSGDAEQTREARTGQAGQAGEKDLAGQGWNAGERDLAGQGDAPAGRPGGTGAAVGSGTGGESSGGNPQGAYSGRGDTSTGGQGGTPGRAEDRPENEPIDDQQWKGNRFSPGGSLGNSETGGTNG